MKAETAALITPAIAAGRQALLSEERLADVSLPGEDRSKYRTIIEKLKSGGSLKGESLIEVFRVMQVELMPELGTGFQYRNNDYLDGEKYGGKYVYFAPSYALRSGLLNEELLVQLFQHPDWKILSVGAGGAFLEKFLIQIGAVARDNLIVADYNSNDLPAELNAAVFDMNKPWPALGREFNLILFSESLCGIKRAAFRPAVEPFLSLGSARIWKAAISNMRGF
jgi:hypothetical protein